MPRFLQRMKYLAQRNLIFELQDDIICAIQRHTHHTCAFYTRSRQCAGAPLYITVEFEENKIIKTGCFQIFSQTMTMTAIY